MSDGLTDTQKAWVSEHEAVPTALSANRARRAQANAELAAARLELRDLLARGQAAGLDVSALASAAGVSRDTAHRALREAGSLSWRQKHRLADDADIPQGEMRRRWFEEQGLR